MAVASAPIGDVGADRGSHSMVLPPRKRPRFAMNPFNHVDDHVLGLIFAHLARYTNVLRCVCRRWRHVVGEAPGPNVREDYVFPRGTLLEWTGELLRTDPCALILHHRTEWLEVVTDHVIETWSRIKQRHPRSRSRVRYQLDRWTYAAARGMCSGAIRSIVRRQYLTPYCECPILMLFEAPAPLPLLETWYAEQKQWSSVSTRYPCELCERTLVRIYWEHGRDALMRCMNLHGPIRNAHVIRVLFSLARRLHGVDEVTSLALALGAHSSRADIHVFLHRRLYRTAASLEPVRAHVDTLFARMDRRRDVDA